MTTLIIAPMIIWFPYEYARRPKNAEELGPVNLIFVEFVLRVSLTFVWLMASGRMPAYAIRVEE